MYYTITLYFSVVFIDARINVHVLLSLNERRLERFGVSLGFQFAIMSVIEDLVHSYIRKYSLSAIQYYYYCNSIHLNIFVIKKKRPTAF